jgi:hypothetical protein
MDTNAEKEEARQIVFELGCLPLAIRQVASYVREATKSFALFLDHYKNQHRELHRWVPLGNSLYSHSIATAWAISFQFIDS